MKSSLFVNSFLKYANIQKCFLSAHYKIVSDIKVKLSIAGIPDENKNDDRWEKEREIIIYSVLAVISSLKRDSFDLVSSH